MSITYKNSTKEFVEAYYETDLSAIILRLAPHKDSYSFEDARNYVCERLLHHDRSEKYDESKGMAYSSYMYMCIRSLLFSFLHKTNNDLINENAYSLDEQVFDDNPETRGDRMEGKDPKTEVNLDFKMVCEKLFEKLPEIKKNSKMGHKELLEAMLLDFTPKECSVLYDMTMAGVCAKRNSIRDLYLKIENQGAGEDLCLTRD